MHVYTLVELKSNQIGLLVVELRQRRGCFGRGDVLSRPLSTHFRLAIYLKSWRRRWRKPVSCQCSYPYKECIIQYHCIHSLRRGQTNEVFSDIYRLRLLSRPWGNRNWGKLTLALTLWSPDWNEHGGESDVTADSCHFTWGPYNTYADSSGCSAGGGVRIRPRCRNNGALEKGYGPQVNWQLSAVTSFLNAAWLCCCCWWYRGQPVALLPLV